MKRLALILVICMTALALAACRGGKDAQSSAEAEPARQAEPPQQTEPARQASAFAAQAEENRPVDLDLTKISGTVAYSQVYDMMMEPDAYAGQKIKMKGNFNYYQDPETRQEYFAAVIADATACCAQGIEFIWRGEHSYPKDYPPLDTEITVTGIFETYFEDGCMYIRLNDADVSW